MVFNFLPAGWNPLDVGGAKAISMQLPAAISGSQAASLASTSESLSTRQRQNGRFSLKVANALQKFPLKVAITSGALTLSGDTIAQCLERYKRKQLADAMASNRSEDEKEQTMIASTSSAFDHDFVRAARMSSYGFLLYAPGTHMWYHMLDKVLVGQSLQNFSLKVLANQVVLGPCILLVVFAWNFAWMGKMKELPAKYRKDLLPSVVKSWKFWLPATCLNFGVVPLHCRVAFMSTCGIFWNFYLSSNIGK